MLVFAIGHLMITNNGLQLLPLAYKPWCLDSVFTCCVMLATLCLFLAAVVRLLPVAGIDMNFALGPSVSTSLQVSTSFSIMDAANVCFFPPWGGQRELIINIFKQFKNILWTRLEFRVSAPEHRRK